MSTRARLWLITGLTFVLFTVATLVVRAVVEPTGNAAWLVLGGLAALGLTATGIVHRFLSLRWKDRIRREKIAAREDQITQAFAAARKRLAASGRAESPRIGKLPLVLLLGPQGSTKTTAVLRSGLDPELLAGEVHQGDAVVPTETVNLWFAEDAVFLEIGGRLLEQDERWEAVLDHAQPHRLAAALGRGTQASRVAVVCVGCDEFIKPGASESIPALARKLRDRLVAAAQALGIQLPVYVLFTRADRLPYFDDYVRSLSREEAQQALGSILPIEDPSRAGAFAEVQARRVGSAVDGVLRNLALNRREVIKRESDADVQAGAYEFPRELGKTSGLLQRFLVDVCRPSQLDVSPFLRGFYFTGVRAVMVSDPGAAPAPRSPGPEKTPMGATAVFDPSKIQAEAARAAAPSSPRSRRVPDWVFLEPVFRDVVLADRSARAVTSGGSRVDFLRRSLLTAAAAVALFAAGAFTVSFFKNRSLARETVEAADVAGTAGSASSAIPILSDLEALEALRIPADSLWTWERNGAPWSMRWGLYAGDDLWPDARRAYLSAFERVLGGSARAALLASLRNRQEEGGASDYEATYRALKAYLIMTDYPEYSSADFLPPAVLDHWPVARSLDPEASELLQAQLVFFAEIITEGHPSAPGPDAAVVAQTRSFLSQFADADRFYQSMITDAASHGERVDFAARFPTASGVMRNGHVIPAAYTRPARRFVLDADVNEFFSSEDWVVGGAAVPPENRAALADSLRSRYEREYVQQWTDFLSSAEVVRFSGAGDAAVKLGRLSAAQSPLLEIVALTSAHTDVIDSTLVRDAFQSVHAVLPPGLEDTYIGEHNQVYIDALRSLRSAMDQVATANEAGRSSALGQANQAASQTEGAVQSLEQGFGIGAAGEPVRTALRGLLLQPVRRAEALIRNIPSSGLNQRGQTFCGEYTRLLSGFPFEPGASRPASVQDVIQALKPGESALSSLFSDVLQGLLARQGARYQPRLGAEPAPRADFVAFFNQATAVSEALFDENGQGPQVVFTIRPDIPEGYSAITVSVDGTTNRFTPTNLFAEPILWEAQRGQYARITGELDGAEVPLVEAAGSPWAIFELFQQARWEPSGPNHYRVHWTLPGRGTTLSAEIGLTTPHPVLDPSFLQSGTRCVSRIAG